MDAANEASDNVRYLGALERAFEVRLQVVLLHGTISNQSSCTFHMHAPCH